MRPSDNHSQPLKSYEVQLFSQAGVLLLERTILAMDIKQARAKADQLFKVVAEADYHQVKEIK